MTYIPPKGRQLFIIPSSVYRACKQEDVTAIVEDLKALDLFHLPYPVVDLDLPADDACIFVDKDGKPTDNPSIGLKDGRSISPTTFVMRVVNLSLDPTLPVKVFLYDSKVVPEFLAEEKYTAPNLRESCLNLLISILATRNVEKRVKENKLAKFGIGTKKPRAKYSITNILLLPKVMEADPDNPGKPGGRRAPHLRRGHIRNQRHGPGFTQVKQIFIDPVFVNADENWVSTRTAYKLEK